MTGHALGLGQLALPAEHARHFPPADGRDLGQAQAIRGGHHLAQQLGRASQLAQLGVGRASLAANRARVALVPGLLEQRPRGFELGQIRRGIAFDPRARRPSPVHQGPGLGLDIGEIAGQARGLVEQGVGGRDVARGDEVLGALAQADQEGVAGLELRLDRADLRDERAQLLRLALTAERQDDLARGAEPHGRSRRQQGKRGPARGLGQAKLAPPATGLGLHHQQRALHLAVVAIRKLGAESAEPEAGARDGAVQIIGHERLLGGAMIGGSGAAQVAAAAEVLGQHDGLGVGALEQPLGRQPVTQAAILVGEHGVRGLANQRVREGESGTAIRGDRRHRGIDQLTVGQSLQGLTHRRTLAAEQQGHPIAREGLAEHGGRAQRPPALGPLGLEARLNDAQDGFGHFTRTAGTRGADQLLEEEGIAVPTPHDLRHHVLGGGPGQGSAHQAFTGAPGEWRQLDHVDLPFSPQVGEHGLQIRPRQRQHHEGLVAQTANRAVEQIDRARVAPLHVVEHHQHGLDRALGAHPFLEGAPGGVGHQHGVLACGAQGLVRALGEVHAGDLADESGHALARFHRQVAAYALGQLAAPLVGDVGFGDAGQAADRAAKQGERRARGQRITGSGQHQGRLLARAQPAHEFLQQARLADAGRARHQHRGRLPLQRRVGKQAGEKG